MARTTPKTASGRTFRSAAKTRVIVRSPRLALGDRGGALLERLEVTVGLAQVGPAQRPGEQHLADGGDPRERQAVDDLPAHDAGDERRQQQVADRRRPGRRSSAARGIAAARAPAPGILASAQWPASRRFSPSPADPSARTAWSRTCLSNPLSTFASPGRMGCPISVSGTPPAAARRSSARRPTGRRCPPRATCGGPPAPAGRARSWRRRRWRTAPRTARRRGAAPGG